MKPEDVLDRKPDYLTSTDCLILYSSKEIKERYEKKYGSVGICDIQPIKEV